LCNHRALNTATAAKQNKVADGPEVPSDTTATTVLPEVRCVGLHCHAAGPHLATDQLFGSLKQHLGGCLLHSNKELKVTVREWLRMQEPDFYSDRIFELFQIWDRCINLLGIILKRSDT
jgi:hypothetical protein